MQEDLKQSGVSGLLSIGISVPATYAVSLVYPASGLTWALVAVVFASFFSGFFSRYYAETAE